MTPEVGMTLEGFEEESEEELDQPGVAGIASTSHHRIPLCNLRIRVEAEDKGGLLVANFTNIYTCQGLITINAAYNYIGSSLECHRGHSSPSSIYSSGGPVKNGAYFLEIITVGGIGPQTWGFCINYTYKKKTTEV